MNKCSVKRGIITLRDCGNDATDLCAICGRPMCGEHSRIKGAELVCVECYAKQSEAQKATASGSSAKAKAPSASTHSSRRDDWEDESWPYMYRHHYYTSYHYSPFYHGSYYDSYYDDYDVRAFDSSVADQIDNDEAAEGGFFDS